MLLLISPSLVAPLCSVSQTFKFLPVSPKTNRVTDGEQFKCCNGQGTYIGETGRNLNIRLTEHKLSPHSKCSNYMSLSQVANYE